MTSKLEFQNEEEDMDYLLLDWSYPADSARAVELKCTSVQVCSRVLRVGRRNIRDFFQGLENAGIKFFIKALE
jgi:hypothetical protein